MSAAPIPSRPIPRLPGLPIVGNLLQYRRDRFGFMKRIGDQQTDVIRSWMGSRSLNIITSPQLAHEALVEHDADLVKGFGLSIFGRPLLGNGLLTSEGDLHRRQRRMMAPAFVNKRIAEYASVIVSRTETTIAALQDGEPLDVAQLLMRLTLEIVGKTLFDAEIGPEAEAINQALTEAMEQLMAAITSLIPLPPSVPTPGNLKSRRAIARLDAIVYRMIRERRDQKVDKGDFLSMLLLAQDEDDGSVMTDKQVRDEAMTIVLAGHETTANALAWTYYLLGQYPAIRARMEHEVDAALRGRSPTLADLPKMPYLLQVLKEAMRLYPPAYVFTRLVVNDVNLGGYCFAKGQILLFNICGMHRRADLFVEPHRFDPDRFTPEAEKKLPRLAYMPFGAGARVCIGNHFALMEGHLILAALTQKVRFDPPPGAPRIDAEPLVTLRPKGGVPVIVHRRDTSAP